MTTKSDETTGDGGNLPGPVEILCDEIRFRFRPAMERPEIFAAFVRQLVNEVDSMREIRALLSERMGSPSPSKGSETVLSAAKQMVSTGASIDQMITASSVVHDLCHELNPEDAYPTDHLIDMLSGCASAIRFGLEQPCRSRHAASAARHIWERRYGVSLSDEYTSAWSHDWTRDQLQSAILEMTLPHGGFP